MLHLVVNDPAMVRRFAQPQAWREFPVRDFRLRALVHPKDDYRVASGVRSPEALDSNGLLGLDLFDLRTFQRKVADQPFFVEYEAQDRLLQGFAVVCAAGALRYQSDLRIHTDIEPVPGLAFPHPPPALHPPTLPPP